MKTPKSHPGMDQLVVAWCQRLMRHGYTPILLVGLQADKDGWTLANATTEDVPDNDILAIFQAEVKMIQEGQARQRDMGEENPATEYTLPPPPRSSS